MRRRELIRFISLRRRGGSVSSIAAPPPSGTAPTITSGNSFSAAENQTGIGTVTATGDGPLVYSLDAGGDAALLAINSSTGVLTFASAPNFEAPADANTDNAYQATVRVTGATSPAATQAITVSVTNVADVAPIVTASQSFSVVENASNGTVVGTVLVTAGDSATDNFEITSGNTGTVFAISSAGVLTKVGALDYDTLSSYTLGVRAHNDAGWSSSVNVGVGVTEAVVWPVAASVTPYAAATGTDMTLPTDRTPVTDAHWSVTKLKRISYASEVEQNNGVDRNNFGPVYAAQQTWSKDGDMMLIAAGVMDSSGVLGSEYSNTSLHLYTGDGVYMHKCSTSDNSRGLQGAVRWSNSVNDEVLFCDIYTNAAAIQKWTPSTRAFSVLKDFSPTYDQISPDWCGGVSDPDITGRYFALGLRKPSTVWYVVCWDRQTDTILSEIAMPSEPGNYPLPQVEMSRSGTYVTIAAQTSWTEAGSTSRGPGISIYQRDGTFLRTFWHGPGSGIGDQSGATSIIGHQGNAQDVNGNDVYLFLYGDTGNSDDRRFKSIRLDGSQSMPGRDECDNGILMGLHYIEAYSYNAPGWALVSDGAVTSGSAAAAAYPMRGHIWAMKLDGSKTIYPIAQARISMVDFTASDTYYTLNWATMNRDMTKIIFKSGFDTNWSAGSGGLPSAFHAIIASAA